MYISEDGQEREFIDPFGVSKDNCSERQEGTSHVAPLY
jgi:hypothetical protein